MADSIEPVTHLEKTIAGEVEPVTHLEHVIALYGGSGSGSGGTTNYNVLTNKPSINGVTLTGNKTLKQLGLLYEEEIKTAASVWSIQHNLNTEWNSLFINMIDSNDDIVYGDIDVINSTKNLLVIKFNEPIAGKIAIRK